MSQSAFAKPVKITIGSAEPGMDIHVSAQFNPASVEISKSVPWSKVNEANKSNQGSDQGQGIHMEFTGAEGRETSIDLMFDEFEKGDGSVAKAIANLEKLASVRVPGSTKEDERRPPRCVVVWGNTFQNFSCVITSLSTKYTMFDQSGNPVRATCTVKLKEADVVSAKSSSSGSSSSGAT
jgi:hypothetical protein